jgi:hypothetical protein
MIAPAKFAFAQRVHVKHADDAARTDQSATVLHVFICNRYGRPDEWRYTVRMSDGAMWECTEDELHAI